MMFHALATGASDRILIALYNPERALEDVPGGARHLVAQARARRFKTIRTGCPRPTHGMRSETLTINERSQPR
jgi:hypothetical protein